MSWFDLLFVVLLIGYALLGAYNGVIRRVIGLMALWGSLGTFNFGDTSGEKGIFSLVRPAALEDGTPNAYRLQTPFGMVGVVTCCVPAR